MKKLKKLNGKELKDINGGSDFAAQGGLGSAIGIGNLLTISSETQNGDEHTKNSLSVGNDINGDTTGIFDSFKS